MELTSLESVGLALPGEQEVVSEYHEETAAGREQLLHLPHV